MTTSKDLLEEFVYFILGRGTEKEVPGEADHILRQRLIARCDHLSDEVSAEGGLTVARTAKYWTFYFLHYEVNSGLEGLLGLLHVKVQVNMVWTSLYNLNWK